MIGLRMPAETGRLLSEISVEGEAVDFGHAHVTVVYLGDDVPLPAVLKAVEVCYDVAQRMRPIKCSTRHTFCFPPSDEGKHPIICPIDSPDLHVLHAGITAGLDAAGVEYSKKWPEYRPHTTLAYADAPYPVIDFDPIEWTAFELTVWGGDHRDSRIVIAIPFYFKSDAKLAARVAARWLGQNAG
jgi:2'-5' RNA ligase